MYSESSTKKIESLFIELKPRLNDLFLRTVAFSYQLKNETAREFMLYGVSRRLGIMKRSFENIFKLFPVRRRKVLPRDRRTDVEINLHAFLIDNYGVLENLALSMAYEFGIYDGNDESFHIRDVGLFSSKFQKMLNADLRKYLTTPTMKSWFFEYAQDYRHALAHRIAPYVPPAGLSSGEIARYNQIQSELGGLDFIRDLERIQKLQNEVAGLGKALSAYIHTLTGEKGPVKLHAQLVADVLTIEEITKTVLDNYRGKE